MRDKIHTGEKKMTDEKQLKISQKSITFKDFDKLDLKSFGDDLFQVIDKGLSSSIEDMGEKRGWTISLNANFGNGKTTFLKMFEHFMKAEKQENYDVLFINAWESDFYKEPVIAILSEFANWLEKDKDINKNIKKEIIKYIEKLIIIVGMDMRMNIEDQYLRYLTVSVLVYLNKIRKFILKCIKNNDQDKKIKFFGQNLLSSFKQRKTVIDTVRNEIFSEYTKNSGKKLLIIIDELDRARPDYAVRFLEDIKHFFDIENVAFLVAANRTQMEATVKCLYGQDLDFNGYYRKFFKHEMDLPDPYEQIQKFIEHLIEIIKIKFSLDDIDIEKMNRNAYLSCQILRLTLRESENFARIFERICENKELLFWSSTVRPEIYFYPFLICLFLKEKELFQKVLDKKFTLDDFLNFAAKNKGMHDSPENHLLGQVAFFFIQLGDENPKNQEDRDKIDRREQDKILNLFPEIKGSSEGVPIEYRKYSLALRICRIIKQN